MVSPQEADSDGYYNYRGDTFEQADWRCFSTVNGSISGPCSSGYLSCSEKHNFLDLAFEILKMGVHLREVSMHVG